jgi:hypothetical protein
LTIATACSSAGSDVLEIQEVEQGLVGHHDTDLGRVAFSALRDGDDWDVVVELNGLTLVALSDTEQSLMVFDGFVTDTGEPTAFTQDDRAMLYDLMVELAPRAQRGDAWTVLHHTLAAWNTITDTMGMRHVSGIHAQRGAGNVSWCDKLNTYQKAGHDCNQCDATTAGTGYGDDGGTSSNIDKCGWTNGYVSTHGPCSGGNGEQTWKAVPGGAWNCSPSDAHNTNLEYAYGNCMGHYGPGCDWGYGTSYCLWAQNHDQCVRMDDHVTASVYCDDDASHALTGCGGGCW